MKFAQEIHGRRKIRYIFFFQVSPSMKILFHSYIFAVITSPHRLSKGHQSFPPFEALSFVYSLHLSFVLLAEARMEKIQIPFYLIVQPLWINRYNAPYYILKIAREILTLSCGWGDKHQSMKTSMSVSLFPFRFSMSHTSIAHFKLSTVNLGLHTTHTMCLDIYQPIFTKY